MSTPVGDLDLDRRMQRVDALIEEIERAGDPAARSRMVEIVQTVLDFHSQGLARIIERLQRAGEAGHELVEGLVADPLIASLLALHGLHPVGIEERVRRALDEVRPDLGSHGNSVELISVSGNTVALRLQGSCHDRPSSQMALKDSIEEAILSAAPEIETIEFEGLQIDNKSEFGRNGFIPAGRTRTRIGRTTLPHDAANGHHDRPASASRDSNPPTPPAPWANPDRMHRGRF